MRNSGPCHGLDHQVARRRQLQPGAGFEPGPLCVKPIGSLTERGPRRIRQETGLEHHRRPHPRPLELGYIPTPLLTHQDNLGSYKDCIAAAPSTAVPSGSCRTPANKGARSSRSGAIEGRPSFSILSEDSHLRRQLGAGPITASGLLWRPGSSRSCVGLALSPSSSNRKFLRNRSNSCSSSNSSMRY